MAYTPPSVEVTSIANNRIINISEDARIPAIVGTGPSVRTITDAAVTRGTAAYDLLPTSGSVVTLTKVASYPGASASNSAWSTDSLTHYNASGSTGSLYWSTVGQVAGIGKPFLGATYYVSYTYPVPASQYDPQLFVDSKDVQAFYGNEETGIDTGNSATSGLSIGANLALENGAPAVMCVQLSGVATSSTIWTEAFDKLRKKESIGYLVPLASGSTNKLAAHSAAILHANQESAPAIGHEQEVILGASQGQSVSSIVSSATAIADQRAIFAIPGEGVTRTTAGGVTVNLDGAWVAAALAGLITGQPKIITPVTGKVVTGFVIPDDQYAPYDMNNMANNGVLVLRAKSGIIKVRHAVSTDPTNANTREISVVAADDMVRRITRNKLTQRFVGKGIVIDDATTAAVESTVASIWGALRRDRLIQNFGTKTDPTTGEVPISAQRDGSEPSRINVTGSIQFLYPLNWINVEFFIYV